MTDDADPPELPPAERPRDIAGMLEAINTDYNELERYCAGYNTLSRVFQTLTKQVPPGQRPKGLMLAFKGSVDDVHGIDVVIDVQKDVDPQHAPGVVVPLANGQAFGMLRAAERLIADATALRDQIRLALGVQPEAPKPAPLPPA